MAGALPTLLVGGSAGLVPDLDLGAWAVTHAGIAHAFGATVRWRPDAHLGAGLGIDESLFTVTELAGVDLLQSPFGNRTAITPQFLASTTTATGVELGWTGGAEIAVVRTIRQDGRAARIGQPRFDTLWAELAASWPREHGAFFVRVRAILPVQAEFHVLGYLPWIAVGRSWRVR
jgi:hypothetical protein